LAAASLGRGLEADGCREGAGLGAGSGLGTFLGLAGSGLGTFLGLASGGVGGATALPAPLGLGALARFEGVGVSTESGPGLRAASLLGLLRGLGAGGVGGAPALAAPPGLSGALGEVLDGLEETSSEAGSAGESIESSAEGSTRVSEHRQHTHIL
jgi:hypothetical protein